MCGRKVVSGRVGAFALGAGILVGCVNSVFALSAVALVLALIQELPACGRHSIGGNACQCLDIPPEMLCCVAHIHFHFV